jgi:hypothetical protein
VRVSVGQTSGAAQRCRIQDSAREFPIRDARVIRPLALTRTAPNPDEPRAFWSFVASLRVTAADVERAREAFAASGIDRKWTEAGLAQGYAAAGGRWIWPTGLIGPMRPMAHGFTLSTTGGLVASAPDVARFSIASASAMAPLNVWT